MSKITIDQIKIELQLKSWLYIDGDYKNLDSELEMMCPEGHKVFFSLKQWRRKPECPTCSANIYSTLKDVASIQKKNGAFRILSLDDSTTITGWSVFDDDKLVGFGKFQCDKRNPTERISEMKQWMLSMLAKWKPDLVAIEDIQQQENIQIFKVLAQLQGVLVNALFENKYEFDIIHVATWRSHCQVKGKTRSDLKKDAQAKIKAWYDVSVSQDEADAICLGRCAVSEYAKNNEFYGWE